MTNHSSQWVFYDLEPGSQQSKISFESLQVVSKRLIIVHISSEFALELSVPHTTVDQLIIG